MRCFSDSSIVSDEVLVVLASPSAETFPPVGLPSQWQDSLPSGASIRDATTAVIVTAEPLALDSTLREFVGRATAVINPVGKLAALLSVALAGSLVSTVLHSFHASVLGIPFGPVDTV